MGAGPKFAAGMIGAVVMAQFAAAQTGGAAPGCDGTRVLTEAVTAIRNEAMGRERVDWERELTRLHAGLGEGTPEAAAPLVEEALRLLDDPHARFTSAAAKAAPAKERGGTAGNDNGKTPAAHPPVPTVPEGRMIGGNVAYVLLPMRSDAPEAALREYVERGRSVIAELAARTPSGWVVDLRLNGGGTVWPMLAALAPLLGDGVAFTSVGAMSAKFGLTGGSAWMDAGQGAKEQFAAPMEARVPAGKVAVLIGGWTMSSGESLAIALRGVRGARLFGEATAGLTTVTQTYTLCDGSVLILPVSRMGDREGRAVVGTIAPDEAAAMGDWPSDDDAAARAAAAWVSGKKDAAPIGD